MRIIVFAGVMVMAASGSTRSFAQEEGCAATAISFGMNSTRLDLEAQADLNRLANWLMEENGRYVIVSPHQGPQPADTTLAQVRASVVAQHLEFQGVLSSAILVAEPEVVPLARRQSYDHKARVAVTTCSGVPPANSSP